MADLGHTLNGDGTQLQRLDRIEQKVIEVGARADEAARAARDAAESARAAHAGAAEVSRLASESFGATKKSLDEMTIVLFGSKLDPDGGAIGRINTKLDTITNATASDDEKAKDSRLAAAVQRTYMKWYFVVAVAVVVAGQLITHYIVPK